MLRNHSQGEAGPLSGHENEISDENNFEWKMRGL